MGDTPTVKNHLWFLYTQYHNCVYTAAPQFIVLPAAVSCNTEEHIHVYR